MVIKISVRGLARVNEFITKLPKKMDNEMNKKSIEFARNTQKSAKLRAPRFSGQLAESISVRTGKNQIKITVESPYGMFQEFGFTPHFLPRGMVVHGGYRISDWMSSKGLTGTGIIPSGQPHPFIIPALKINLAKLPTMLTNATKNAIKGAGR